MTHRPNRFRLLAGYAAPAGIAVAVAVCLLVASGLGNGVFPNGEESTAEAAENGRNLILVSWDGVRRDRLHTLLEWQPLGESPRVCPNVTQPPRMPVVCGQVQSCMPTLCAFQVIDSQTVGHKTMTRPQHATMLSGYTAEQTGVRSNSGGRLPPGLSIYERIAQLIGPSVRIGHIAMPKYVSQGVTRWARRAGLFDVYNKPAGPDGFTGRNTVKRVIPALQELSSGRFFLFAHFKTADKMAHKAGDRGDRYLEAIMNIDARLGEMRQALVDLGVARNTDIYVTTDHGFHGRRHVIDDFPTNVETWIASSAHDLDGSSTAQVIDVVPTILSKLGADLGQVDPPFPGLSRLRQNSQQ